MRRRNRLRWRVGVVALVGCVAVFAEAIAYTHSAAAPPRAGSAPGYTAPPTLPPPSTAKAITAPLSGETIAQDGTGWIVQTPGKPWSVSLSPSYDRFELRGGDSWVHDLKHGKVVKNRAELQGPVMRYDTDYWLAWSVRVPKSSNLSPKDTVIGQLHATGDRTDVSGRGPVLEFRLIGHTGRFLVTTRSDPAAVSKVQPGAVVRYAGAPVPRNRWLDLVVSVRFTRVGPGHLFVWLDGREVVDLPSAPIGYNDAIGPYWKFGNYRPAYSGTSVIEYANMTLSTTSLAPRIAHPLPPGGPET